MEVPHAFHPQLEHHHCLFINSSFCRTTAASPQQQLGYGRLFSPVTLEPAMLAKQWSSQL
jgi:hypothetical protein